MDVKELVGALKQMEEQRKECADHLRTLNAITECNGEEKISVKVGAVDASIIAQEFHSFDLIITKCVGAVFKYENGKLKSYKYIPSPFPKEKLHTHGTMDLVELNQYRTIVRLTEEIRLAQKVAEKCDILFLDGSIVPLQNDKPSSKVLKKMYEKLKLEYIKLYSEHGSKIVGVIKDSRSRRFIEEYLGEEWKSAAENSTDSILLNMAMKKGEMTLPIKHSKDVKSNNVLRDFMPYAERMEAIYIKAGKNDMPIRIEMLGYDEAIVKKVYALCAINDNYAYPAILIDVDLRAMIDPKHVERMLNEVELSPFLKDSNALRRNRRPFR